ncbi:hypothetical protein Leryth_024274 [Lithospermum erythrorhizon]|nr:hypothetical protein Leryth_024274 [Lithospermum erythrorhizon]
MTEEVKLFRNWSSPFALRIVWALSIKGIEYETIYEDLTAKSPSLLQYNPINKKVPVLLHNGKPICESLVILEYLDETWKQNPLLPQDPYEKAQARFWAKFGDEKVLESFRQVLTSQGKEQEDAVVSVQENLTLIEKQLEGKKFFGGETIGYLDIAYGWIANLNSVLEIVCDVKVVDADKFPKLLAWMHTFSEVPEIKEFFPPHERLVSKFQAMRKGSLAAGGNK